jgi:succinate dehydrogenase/fumarate reductase cytochrome b subunit
LTKQYFFLVVFSNVYGTIIWKWLRRLSMKKIVRKVAMILILVMLCNCFLGCRSMATDLMTTIERGVTTVIYGTLIAMGIGAVIGLIVGFSTQHKIQERGPRRTNPYLFENDKFKTAVSVLPKEEMDSLAETFCAMPAVEFNSFMAKLNSLSETESVTLMESACSFSGQELAAILATFNSMPESEKISSIEMVNSLPKTVSLAGLIQNVDVDAFRKTVCAGQNF